MPVLAWPPTLAILDIHLSKKLVARYLDLRLRHAWQWLPMLYPWIRYKRVTPSPVPIPIFLSVCSLDLDSLVAEM